MKPHDYELCTTRRAAVITEGRGRRTSCQGVKRQDGDNGEPEVENRTAEKQVFLVPAAWLASTMAKNGGESNPISKPSFYQQD